MAAKVGSVIVDVVANTAEFEAGMKRAADVTQGVGAYVTEKSYVATQASGVAQAAAERHAQSAQGVARAIGGIAASMAASLGVGNQHVAQLFRMSEYSAMLADRTREVVKAMSAQSKASGGAVTVGRMMAATIAATAAKLAILTAVVYSVTTAWKRYKDEQEAAKRRTEGTTEYIEAGAKSLELYYRTITKVVAEEDRIIGKFQEGAYTYEQARVALVDLAEQRKDTFDEVDDMIWRRGLDDQEKKLQEIRDQYAEIAEKAKGIADETTRGAVLARIDEMRRSELLAIVKAQEEEVAEAARKAHAEKMEQYREQAQAIAETMMRAAGLASGDVQIWKSIQDAARQTSADRAQKRMLEQSGAMTLDAETKDDIRKMREYLLTLATSETVAI